jgi:AcrR family transcriptional regulator
MPRLWKSTVEEHRREVNEAILDTTAALVSQHGLRSVTMSEIAESVGIGRATLYKYYPDIEEILRAWHEREIASHLTHLNEVRSRATGGLQRLAVVLQAYADSAFRCRDSRDPEFVRLLHIHGEVVEAEQRLLDMIRELITEAAKNGEVRSDVSADELAIFCLSAVAAAKNLQSQAAVKRLIGLILSGLSN